MADESAFDDVEIPSSSNNLEEFELSQSLAVHSGAVRCLATDDLGVLLSGSIDKSVKVFTMNDSGKYDFDRETTYHDSFVYDIATATDAYYTCSKDKKIIKMDKCFNPVAEFLGHEMVVSSVEVIDNETIISGSWDATAKIWDSKTQKELFKLEGHAHAVKVMPLDNGTIVTGSQDGKIRLWSKTGSFIKEWDAHSDIIRDFTLVKEIGFASCSNDGTANVWSMDGSLLQELNGHDGFIFSIL